MQLNSEQIDLVDRYLEQRNLLFFDLKTELMDHISCEIEEEMAVNNMLFESASVAVFERWESELKIKKSWLIGLENRFPKFVVRNLFKKVLFHYCFVLVSVLLISVLIIKKSSTTISENLLTIFNFSLVLLGISYFLMKRKVNQTKIKTTYSFQFDYFYFPILLIFIYLFVIQAVYFKIALMLFLVVNCPFAFYFYFKHFQTIKKFNHEN